MKKPKSKLKQLAAQKRAAKRNKRDIKVRNEAYSRRVKMEDERKTEELKQKKFMDELKEAQSNFQKSNGL